MTTITGTIRQRIEDYLASHGAVVSAVAAKEIEADLEPAQLAAWLYERRFEILASYITVVSRATGSHRAAAERKSVFADNASDLEDALTEAAERGDDGPVREFFKMWHCGNEDGKPVRKRLGDMTRQEVLFHRNRQQNNIRYYQRRVRFLKAVADQVPPGQVVGDVFTPDELDRMLDSLT